MKEYCIVCNYLNMYIVCNYLNMLIYVHKQMHNH